ncbi:MAG: hypothetical protein F4Z82_07280 [Caldilineaceae bacterium SB0668_bin_21]|nr:hypothetical protein [Caldilineaceae bacterium SB0668_bin_21]MYC23427.1 hypothetical protein [Caldilineaceae bacterium SB0662_bin_25]
MSSSPNEKVDSLARELKYSRNELPSAAVQESVERDETRVMMAALKDAVAARLIALGDISR